MSIGAGMVVVFVSARLLMLLCSDCNLEDHSIDVESASLSCTTARRVVRLRVEREPAGDGISCGVQMERIRRAIKNGRMSEQEMSQAKLLNNTLYKLYINCDRKMEDAHSLAQLGEGCPKDGSSAQLSFSYPRRSRDQRILIGRNTSS